MLRRECFDTAMYDESLSTCEDSRFIAPHFNELSSFFIWKCVTADIKQWGGKFTQRDQIFWYSDAMCLAFISD